MKNILFALTFLCSLDLAGQKYRPTSELLNQVFIIQTPTNQGTAFLTTINGNEYLVTAKHLFDQSLICGSNVQITLAVGKGAEKFEATYFFQRNSTFDVAVLRLKKAIKIMEPIADDGPVTLGDEVIFLGYPSFGTQIYSTNTAAQGRLPLVKRAIISGFIQQGESLGYYLDGHNNPGFSGGPVVGYNNSSNKPYFIGILTAYIYEPKFLADTAGAYFKDYIVQENSGIALVYPLSIAKKIVESEIK